MFLFVVYRRLKTTTMKDTVTLYVYPISEQYFVH